MMNYHLLFYKTGARLREYQKHLRTRRAYCLLATITYTNTLLFTSMMFRQYELLVDTLFCISSILIGISVTGLYLSTPFIMIPDVVFKVTIATCAFFFAIKETDEGNEGSGIRLVFVILGYGLQFYENYFLFNAMIHLYMTKVQPRPPPEYNFFAITAPKAPEFNEEEKIPETRIDVEPFDGNQPGSSTKKQHEEEENEKATYKEWSSTPPPSYAAALARMAREISIEQSETVERCKDTNHPVLPP